MATVTLGSKAEGSFIKLNENENLANYYVAKQNYESGLNGAGRVLVVRRDCYVVGAWGIDNDDREDYERSVVDAYLNGTYKNMLDADIRTAMGTTKIYVTRGTSVVAIERSAFLLSGTELGFSYQNMNAEGTKLPTAQTLRNSTLSDIQWTRSPTVRDERVFVVQNGNEIFPYRCESIYRYRPAFTLPATLHVSDDGSVSVNTAPGTPASISVPDSIQGGTTITVSWGASTDAESNLEGYIVERSTNGGTSWSQIYQGGARTTTNNVAFGTASVMYRVRAYDTEGLQSGWRTSGSVTVVNNRAPGAPGSITVPAAVQGGATLSISWTKATDSDGNLSGYELERSVNGGSWSQVYKGSALTYTDTITAGWNTVAYRVRAYDALNDASAYVTSATCSVDNNAAPVITSATASGTDLGVKNEGFALTYKVTDADGDTVTVKEYLDNVLQRTYTATLGQSSTFQAVTAANYQQILNGVHTLRVVANDGKADSAPYIVTFTKKVTSASITLAEPLDADDAITITVLRIAGVLPADAVLQVLVTNNARDTAPVWEDATADIRSGANHIFTNKTAANGFAFNFKVSVRRGTSDTGGYISSIGGAFE